MATPKVSLIIPVYNKAPFLKRCLESIEPVEGLEVIIIDDHSTDGSKAILDAYKDKFQIIYRKKNYGVSNARNYGMSLAKGDYIAFLDADDKFVTGACASLVKMAYNPMSHNIIQFGRYIMKQFPILRTSRSGWYELEDIPQKSWILVWNKLYRREWVEELRLKFREDLTFGEDEMFNVAALSANKGMWIVSKALIDHYLDDLNSICRGGLCVEWLELLYRELVKAADETDDSDVERWLWSVIDMHEKSKTFRDLGFIKKPIERKGKYDVVYLLKDTKENPELKYSLRSVVENFPFRNVVFAGGKPEDLEPDLYINVAQCMPSKWENTWNNLRSIANDNRITEDFWLFNDDFFVLKPALESMPPSYYGTIDFIVQKTERGFGRPIAWTTRLRHLERNLKKCGKDTLNYAVHKPMLINRKKLAELLGKFDDEPMIRALYGNYYKIGGVDEPDRKVRTMDYDLNKVARWDFVSTQDDVFKSGNIGRWLRDKFPEKSRFEV